jgi:tetratricopeptide (TPR) repeat protein
MLTGCEESIRATTNSFIRNRDLRKEAAPMLKTNLQRLLFGLLMTAAPGVTLAQSFPLDLPLQSPAAEVSQTIGLTDITIKYHRPSVKDRKIWDGLVPYGKVWRTGANINTTITFSDPVTIDGKPLDKGTYGLHVIPNVEEWTIIFSKNSTSWGSFSYDQSEDALRIAVKPQAANMHEALTFEFNHLQPDSAVIDLEWEKLEVPFKVSVNLHDIVLANLKRQLRTLPAYVTWTIWDDAAKYLLTEKIDLDDALTYADKSIKMEDRFDNEMTKSKLLSALNRKDEAMSAQNKALDLGTPLQVHEFAGQLLSENRREDAFAIFRGNAAKYPNQWFVHEGLARVYSAQGRFGDAEKEVQIALAAAPGNQKGALESLMKRLQAKQDINSR